MLPNRALASPGDARTGSVGSPEDQKMKLMTVFGTRPVAIKMFPVVHALQRQDGIDVRVCVTAQHREMLDQVLEIARIIPDIDLDVMTTNQTLDALLARLVTGLGETFDREKPDRKIGRAHV